MHETIDVVNLRSCQQTSMQSRHYIEDCEGAWIAFTGSERRRALGRAREPDPSCQAWPSPNMTDFAARFRAEKRYGA